MEDQTARLGDRLNRAKNFCFYLQRGPAIVSTTQVDSLSVITNQAHEDGNHVEADS